jgi:hypothetical protein
MEEKQSQQSDDKQQMSRRSIAYRASFLTADDLDLDNNDTAASAISTTGDGDGVDSDVAENIDASVSSLCIDNVFANTDLDVQKAVDASFHVSRSLLSRQVSCASTFPSSRSSINEEIGLGCPHEMAGRAAIQVQ